MCVFVTIIRRSLWMNNENKKCLLNAKSIRTKQKLKHRRSFGDPSRPTSQIRLAPLSKLLGFDFRFRRCLLSIFFCSLSFCQKQNRWHGPWPHTRRGSKRSLERHCFVIACVQTNRYFWNCVSIFLEAEKWSRCCSLTRHQFQMIWWFSSVFSDSTIVACLICPTLKVSKYHNPIDFDLNYRRV